MPLVPQNSNNPAFDGDTIDDGITLIAREPSNQSAIKPLLHLKHNRSTIRELRRLNATIIDATAINADANKTCTKDSCQLGCLCKSVEPEKNCSGSAAIVDATSAEGISTEKAVSLRRRATARLTTMEKDFSSTLVLSNNDTVLISETQNTKKRRCTMTPKKYKDFDFSDVSSDEDTDYTPSLKEKQMLEKSPQTEVKMFHIEDCYSLNPNSVDYKGPVMAKPIETGDRSIDIYSDNDSVKFVKTIAAPIVGTFCFIHWKDFLADFEDCNVNVWAVQMESHTFTAATTSNVTPSVDEAHSVVNIRYALDPEKLPQVAVLLLKGVQNATTNKMIVVMHGKQGYWHIEKQKQPSSTKNKHLKGQRDLQQLGEMLSTYTLPEAGQKSIKECIQVQNAEKGFLNFKLQALISSIVGGSQELLGNIEFRPLNHKDVHELQIPEPHSINNEWIVIDIYPDFSHIFLPACLELISFSKIQDFIKMAGESQKMVKLELGTNSTFSVFVMPSSKRFLYIGPLPKEMPTPQIVLLQIVDMKIRTREVYQKECSIPVQSDCRSTAFRISFMDGMVYFDINDGSKVKTSHEQPPLLSEVELSPVIIISDDEDEQTEPTKNLNIDRQNPRTNLTPAKSVGSKLRLSQDVPRMSTPIISDARPSTTENPPPAKIRRLSVIESRQNLLSSGKTGGTTITELVPNNEHKGISSSPDKSGTKALPSKVGGPGSIIFKKPLTSMAKSEAAARPTEGIRICPSSDIPALSLQTQASQRQENNEKVNIGSERADTGGIVTQQTALSGLPQAKIFPPIRKPLRPQVVKTYARPNVPVNRQTMSGKENQIQHPIKPQESSATSKITLPANDKSLLGKTNDKVQSISQDQLSAPNTSGAIQQAQTHHKPIFGIIYADKLPSYSARMQGSNYIVKIPKVGEVRFASILGVNIFLNKRLSTMPKFKELLPGKWTFAFIQTK